jgi:hypothetical protein
MPLRIMIDGDKTNVAAGELAALPDAPPAACVSTLRQM